MIGYQERRAVALEAAARVLAGQAEHFTSSHDLGTVTLTMAKRFESYLNGGDA